MADLDDAISLVTDPANLARIHTGGPEERFAVNGKRVMRALRNAGAGKAEARELALQALEKVKGGAEIRSSRGAQAAGGRGGDASTEHWWVPRSAVRF